jgi:hypothetical protein
MGITTENEGPQSQASSVFMRFSESEAFTEYSDSIDVIAESSGTAESPVKRQPLSEEKYLIVSNDALMQARMENILQVWFSTLRV